MKQILQQFTLRASLLVMLLVGAVGSVWGDEVYKTALFGADYNPKNTTYTSSFDATNGSFIVTVTNFNNNNNGWTNSSGNGQIKCGRKTTASTGVIATKAPIDKAITKVVLTIDAITSKNVNSLSLYKSSNNTSWTYVGSFSKSTGTQTVAISTPEENLYYKIEFSCDDKASSNGLVTVSKIEYYYTPSGSTATCATPTFSPAAGTYTSAQNVTISTETSGATIYYTTDGTNPTTNSSTYSSAISVNQTTTIKAMAVKDGMTNSAIAEATYTINIPETNVNWVETSLADLTASDVFVIVGNTYAMTNNNGTESAPVAVSVTIADGKITSNVDDNMKWTISGNATDGYTFYPSGSTTTWLYCNTTAASSSNNNMRVGTGDRKLFKPDGNGYFVTNDTYTSRYISIYNNSDWRGYVNTDNAVALKFYKRVDADVPQPPYISASNVNLTYDATAGSITYAVNNPVAGGSITAVSSENWLIVGTVSNGNIALTCTANSEPTERTATVILTYTYNTNETVTKEVTVTQAAAPVIYSTIPALFDAASTTEKEVEVTFNDWVVSGVSTNGKNVFVTDNSGNGFVIFDYAGGMNEPYPVGSILSGTAVSCHLLKYNGFAEIKNLNASDLTITTGGTITASNIALADLAGVNTGALVSYENLTCSVSSGKYYLSDGTTTIQVFNSLFAFDALEDGKTYNITGIYQQFNDTKEILPRSAADIQEVTVTSTLSWTVGTNIELFVFDAADQNNPLSSPANVTAGTEILVSVSVEQGYQLESLMVDGVDVKNQIVDSGAYTFTMPGHAVTISATATQGSITPVSDGKYVKVTSTDDLTSGQYLIVYEDGNVAFNGGLETLDAVGNTIDVTIANNEIAATTQTAAAEFTIDVTEGTIKSASGYYIGATSYNNELKTNSETAYTNSISFDSNGDAVIAVAVPETQSVTLRYNKASNQTRFRYYKSGQEAIQLYKKVSATPEPDTISVTISAAGYSTLYYGTKNLTVPKDMEAYTVKVTTQVERSTTYKAGYVIPAGTGVVLKAAQGTYKFAVAAEAGPKDDNNMLRGNDEKTLTTGGTYYYALTLDKNKQNPGFYWMVEDGGAYQAGAHKAYLALDNTFAELAEGTETGVKGFLALPGDGIVTGIDNMNVGAHAEIYNLAGQRVKKMQKGIYVVGGKKVMVK